MADKPRIILVDQDGVLAHLEQAFFDRWREQHGEKPFITLEDRRGHFVVEQYPEEHRDEAYNILCQPGFFENLAPLPGAIEALRAMEALGLDVRICTSPLSDYEHCVVEKYRWIEKHLGHAWTKRMILTRDKTLVQGDVLIDDKAEITGANAHPAWEHLLFDAPYNREVEGKKRLTWENWKSVLGVE